MASKHLPRMLVFRPVTPGRWRDLEELFGPRGASAGCWCMFWRLRRRAYERGKGLWHKRAMKKIVAAGPPPGLLAYAGGKPVAWCALAPRERYPALERRPVLKRVDAQPVWSVPCFFVARPFRRRGVTAQLLRAAMAYARRQGARILEGYPVDTKGRHRAAAASYMGFPSAFRRAGFQEVARRSETRPIMRFVIGK